MIRSMLVILFVLANPAWAAVHDEYFVLLHQSPVFKSTSEATINNHAVESMRSFIESIGGTVHNSYLHAAVGLHVQLNSSQQEEVLQDPRVRALVPNGLAYMSKVPSWGLDRIDQENLPLDNNYTIEGGGKGVHAYIIDSGLRATHNQFDASRIGNGVSFAQDQNTTDDCNGHGTHVAGTILGKTVGVANQTTVHPVRVFPCGASASWDKILSAIDWVIANHQKPAVVNMSLGGGRNQAVDEAVKNAVRAGVTVVVAAGNSRTNACSTSPAAAPEAITVAASDSSDRLATFSNFGSCVDIIAPGVNIPSAGHSADDAIVTFSGTSMASPHVAGAVALVQEVYPTASPSDIVQILSNFGVKDKVANPNSTLNILLNVQSLGAGPLVYAGEDMFVRLPQDSVTLIGSARARAGNFIDLTEWNQPSADTNSSNRILLAWDNRLTLQNLTAGEYEFVFQARDSTKAVNKDTVKVTVTDTNLNPVAIAGGNLEVNEGYLTFLDGGHSHDLDGNLSSYLWEKVTGPAGGTIKKSDKAVAELHSITPGVHRFMLTVTDNENSQHSDTLTVDVNARPQVSAGKDFEVQISDAVFTLTGTASDPDSENLRYVWGQSAGPNRVEFSDNSALTTEVRKFSIGTYKFYFAAIDNKNAYGISYITVKVIENTSGLEVSAGDDVEVRLPNNSVVLNGICTDSNGQCVQVSWRLQNKTASITPKVTQVKSELYLSDLSEGIYNFEFHATDNDGNTAFDPVKVTVLPAAASLLKVRN